MNKELREAVELFISQPMNNMLSRSQIMDVARIALPILEQQERDDGWIAWVGGNCPIDKNKVVYVKFRDGDTDNNGAKAGTMDWFHFGEDWDIIGYRVVKP